MLWNIQTKDSRASIGFLAQGEAKKELDDVKWLTPVQRCVLLIYVWALRALWNTKQVMSHILQAKGKTATLYYSALDLATMVNFTICLSVLSPRYCLIFTPRNLKIF